MKYKLSYYTLITEAVDDKETKKILYATRTGSAIVLKTEYIDYLESSQFELIPSEVLNELIAVEALVPANENELFELTEQSKILASSGSSHFDFTIMTTANCQLGCGYCGQEHQKHNASDTLVENILKRFEFKFSENKYSSVDVSWFGGEPLMSWNVMRKLSPELQKIAKAHNCKYISRLTSNGLSLKSNIYEELAVDMKCGGIEITLDGTKEFHDKRRNTKTKEDTFDIIFGNILDITSRKDYPLNGCNISIRCNVDNSNMDGVIPLIHLLAEHNLQDKVYFYVAPVYHWGNLAHLNTDKELFAVKEIDWLIEMCKMNFIVPFLPRTHPIVCNAVKPDFELIDPYGKVYNCTETPLVPFYGEEHIIGDITKDVTLIRPFEQRPFVNWYDKVRDPSNKFYCTTCKILPLCGGRCPKSWEDGVPACPSMKFNMEDRLILSYIYAKSEIKELILSTST